jgi:hypothetical protein
MMQEAFEHPRPGQVIVACPEGINIAKFALGLAQIFGRPVTVGLGIHVNCVPVGTLLIGEL